MENFSKQNGIVDVENLGLIFENWNENDNFNDLKSQKGHKTFKNLNENINNNINENIKKSTKKDLKISKTQKNLKNRRDDHRKLLNELASLIPIHGVCPQACRKSILNVKLKLLKIVQIMHYVQIHVYY